MSGFNLLDDSSPASAPEHRAERHNDQPLGLTVHSIPSPGQGGDGAAGRTRSGRWKMIAVLLICAAPVIASYFAYYVVRPQGRLNFGELIEPQRPLPDLTGVNLQGQALNLMALKGQWLLLSVGGGACDQDCNRHLYLQRQLREAQGKNKDRVDWVWLIPDQAPVPAQLLPALSAATVLRIPAEALSAWLVPAAGHELTEHLYLVDPLGNLMMRFPANADVSSAVRIKRDLDRLLRASASWDQAGRATVQ